MAKVKNEILISNKIRSKMNFLGTMICYKAGITKFFKT